MAVEVIDGFEVTPKLGSVIQPDEWRLSGRLIVGDDFSRFRLTTNNGIVTSLPVRVEVTGRTIQYKNGERTVRVRITFLHDGEPDVTTGGFMYVPW